MPTDLAIDYNTGDLIMGMNNDVGIRTGQAVIDQRIRVRLRAQAGQWVLDPTGGELGSHLRELTRQPTFRALSDAPRMVREALAPLSNEIHIHEVNTNIDPKDQRRLVIDLAYSIIEPGGEAAAAVSSLSTTLQLAE